VEGLPTLNPVDDAARFTAAMGRRYRGRKVKEADPDLVDDLAERGRLVELVDHTHSYPHCWRCGTPLVYWGKPTWFARTSQRKADLLRENETIAWHPEHIKHGRFGDWLENNVDWALSRDRYWGTPIPVWRCTEGHDTCVGSVEELAQRSGGDLTDLDLHRPYVDAVTFPCPECAGTARRVPPVLDAWFDSGAMPAAQLHFPFENQDTFELRFPADFICEAIDQTRGWFYSLLAVNTLVFDRAPYRNVVCLALLVDAEGQKMSKSRGNVIDPWSVLETRGADALRWNFLSAGSPWTNKRVSEQAIDESTRRFLLTLWNTYAFFVTYASLDGWAPGATVGPVTHVLDRWIRSRLHRTTAIVTDALEQFDALRGALALQDLVDDLSNWYVRRSRPRFWKSSDAAAHATLHECLATIAALTAPYCPFVADEVYRNLTGSDSVHLADWPDVDAEAIDDQLEAEMELARDVTSLGRAARVDSKLKVRQPLARAIVLLPRGSDLSEAITEQVAEELNVKAVETVRDLEGLLDHEAIPNFRALGPRLGPLLPRVKDALARADGAQVRQAFEGEGIYRLDIDGTVVELFSDDVEIRARSHEELALAQDGVLAVALDTRLDDDLLAEGVAREVVRFVNDQRKAAGLALSDRIALTLHATGSVLAALRRHADDIAAEVLAASIETLDGEGPAPAPTLEVDGGRVSVELGRT